MGEGFKHCHPALQGRSGRFRPGSSKVVLQILISKFCEINCDLMIAGVTTGALPLPENRAGKLNSKSISDSAAAA